MKKKLYRIMFSESISYTEWMSDDMARKNVESSRLRGNKHIRLFVYNEDTANWDDVKI